MELTLEKYKISEISNNFDTQKKISNTFYYITNKLMDSSFNNNCDSKYTKNDKIVTPYLPYIYLNIIEELYNENLYKKEKSDINKKEINEENSDDNDEKIMNEFNEENKPPDIQKELKGSVNNFYFCLCFDSKLCSEYSDIDPKNLEFIHLAKLNKYQRKISFITLKENFWKLISNIFISNPTVQKKYLFDIIKGLILLIKENQEEFYSEFSTNFLVSLM